MKELKRVTIITVLLAAYLFNAAAMDIKHIEPPFWYTGMKHSELQIMVYGKDISGSEVSISYPGIEVMEVARMKHTSICRNYCIGGKRTRPLLKEV